MRVIKCRKVGGEFRLGKTATEDVCKVVSEGGLVIYPTETVYGLGADPFQEDAVKRIFAVKHRPRSMPISMAIPSHEAIWLYAVLDKKSKRFCEKHMPGPITVLLMANSLAPPRLVSKEGRIGFRVPDNQVALDLLSECSPLTATSANRHGGKNPITCDDAVEQLGGDVDLCIDAGPCRYGEESTVVEFEDGKPRIIRQGSLLMEDF